MSAPLHPHDRSEYYAQRAAQDRSAHTKHFWSGIAGFWLAVVIVSAGAAWSGRRIATVQASPETQKIESSVHYNNCSAARAAGAAPIAVGRPGYRPELDADGD